MRIDKWLWAARFFKTRSLAARACELGRITSNGHTAKPAREVRPADTLHIRTETAAFTVQVLQLTEARGPAETARTLYAETEESLALRQKLAEERKAMPSMESSWEGRPSKRDRRVTDRFRGRN